MSARVIVCPDGEALARDAAGFVEGLIRAALAERPRCSVALSGGGTPLPMNRALARATLPWERVDFFFADERAVPPDDAESNYRGARESLFAPLALPDRQLFRMEAEAPDLDAAARAYEESLPERLDVVILGMGEDGHTCSLFPGHASVEERTRRVLPVTDSPKPPPRRMTLGPTALAAARTLFMLVAGGGKAAAVRRALEETGPAREVPARLAREGTWYLDAPAASELRGGAHRG